LTNVFGIASAYKIAVLRADIVRLQAIAHSNMESTLDYFDKLLDGEKIDTLFNCEVTKDRKRKGDNI